MYLPTTANLTTSPSSGSPFTSLILTRSGFTPSETVSINYTGPSTTSMGTGVNDISGNFSIIEHLPQVAYGTCQIQAIGQTSRKSGAASFSVTPRLILSPLDQVAMFTSNG